MTAERGEQAARHVVDRGAGAHRRPLRVAGHRHQPAHALRDLVEAGAVAVGAVLAEARDRGEDDARIDLRERFVVDPQPVLDVGPEVLDDHVGLLDQSQQQRVSRVGLQVDRDRALVAVQVLHVGAVARAADQVRAQPLRGFDLDHVGAEVGELLHAGGAGADLRQVQHAKVREGSLAGRWGHRAAPCSRKAFWQSGRQWWKPGLTRLGLACVGATGFAVPGPHCVRGPRLFGRRRTPGPNYAPG